MIGAVWTIDIAMPLELFSESGSWFSLMTKVLVGGVVFCSTQYAIWRLEGRPAGLEKRLLQVFLVNRPARSGP
jgi:hypothetical protein